MIELFRKRVRDETTALLTAAAVAAHATVTSSKDTPVQSGTTPWFIVYTDDKKHSLGNAGAPEFRTDVLISIEIRAEGASQADAESQGDTLCQIAENALLGDPAFVSMFEQIDLVETFVEYKGTEGAKHVFSGVIEITAHATEIFEPTINADLEGFNLYVDSVNIFDPNHNYPGQEPFIVPAAPRTSGPDGRPEISGQVDTPE